MTRTITSKTMTLKRQTKGALLYEAVESNGGPVTSIYLRKAGFPSGNYPGSIQLTVTVDEPEE